MRISDLLEQARTLSQEEVAQNAPTEILDQSMVVYELGELDDPLLRGMIALQNKLECQLKLYRGTDLNALLIGALSELILLRAAYRAVGSFITNDIQNLYQEKMLAKFRGVSNLSFVVMKGWKVVLVQTSSQPGLVVFASTQRHSEETRVPDVPVGKLH